ncbi:Ser-Thr-rich glycosyl-phosphatidyl-inositol-anchored membrane family-domain-containing protein [Boeremia exigua]|uniref:Ser-Thr-rich glycosyl-phosphatidyl-inositol-anchored membrane family-domain-containing protein n=1 Tax=Boeremia exigua TaxID=749465 RepID=UPI001E8D9FC3|nr:Ser-Thr-rich glycosyl-phosphatidyl-inositol-anchored membrane family-domain-containing protein [Boeremia exigua]KAH6639245.1 Ser-Thr-rich glycosyl-phosphatidyl-inositol-anchored membrane family-domain-containing protein [Boeremia exigua]
MFTKASIIAVLSSMAAAQLHAPVGEPAGNPITRPLIEVVPACKAFTITWQPTTTNTISLLLLRGPSTNVVPIQTLAEGINNSGSFLWTPASTLEADSSRYGLQLIDDVTGQYQYSTQFGISKDDCAVVVSSSSAAPVVPSSSAAPVVPSSSAAPVAPSSTPAGYPVASSSAAGYPVAPTTVKTSVAPYPTTVKTVAPSASAPGYNGTIVNPTGSLRPSATGAANGTSSALLPESTGAAASIKAGLGLVGAAAFAALML